MTWQCPNCRGDQVAIKRQTLPPQEADTGGWVGVYFMYWGFNFLVKFTLLILLFGLAYLAYRGTEVIFPALCILTMLGVLLAATWRFISRLVWNVVYAFAFFVLRGLGIFKPLEVVYSRSCQTCGCTWERTTREGWDFSDWRAHCSACRALYPAAPHYSRRCVVCGSKRVKLEQHPYLANQENWRLDESNLARQALLAVDSSPLSSGAGSWERRLSAFHIEALAIHAIQDPQAAGFQQAISALKNLSHPESIDAVACVWAASRDASLAEIIADRGWTASAPPEVTVLTSLKWDHPISLRTDKFRKMKAVVRAADDPDPGLASNAEAWIRQISTSANQEALCDIVMQESFPGALRVAIESGFAPQDASRRALYFFLTEQWERYDLLDFDRRLLSTLYATDSSLQARIRDKLRLAGRAEFLSVVAGPDPVAQAGELTEGELEVVVRTLASNSEWPKLWKMAFEVPLFWSVRILGRLSQQDWQPEADEDQHLLETLKFKLANPLPESLQDVRQRLPLGMRRASVRVSGRVNDLAFAPDHPALAIATGARKLVVWNFQHARREQVYHGFDHSLALVAYLEDGTLTCAERTNNTSEACLVYAMEGEKHITLGSHIGPVTALAPWHGRRLISAGRDNAIHMWDLSAGKAETTNDFGLRGLNTPVSSWPRTLCVSSDGSQAAVLYTFVSWIRLPDMVSFAQASCPGTPHRAAFLPDGRLVVGMYNGQVALYPPPTGKRLSQAGSLPQHQGQIKGLASLARRGFLLTAGSEGLVRFVDLETLQSIGEIQLEGNQLTSLYVSPDATFMAIGDSDASMSLWDLRALEMYRLLQRPLAHAGPESLVDLRAIQKHETVDEMIQNALGLTESLLRHRLRFEIEIDEASTIQIGEFDIEIE